MAVTPDLDPIGASLRRRAAQHPARPALLAPAEEAQLTFGQIAALAERLITLNGGGEGRIALFTESRLAQAAILAAGLMAGFVVAPINPASPLDAVVRLLRHSRTTLFIRDNAVPGLPGELGLHESPTQPLLDALPDHPGSALPQRATGGMLVYTSGSTGAPKGVLLTEANIAANVAFAIHHFGFTDAWVTGSVLPLFHTFSVISDLLPMLVVGGRVVITPGLSVARLQAAAKAFAEHNVQSYSGVPIIFDTMLAMRFPQPASVKFAIAGAAPLGERTRLRYASTYGHPILPCYGLTETTCFATVSSPDDIRPGCVGRAAGIDIEIVNEDGASLPVGETGEIACRGASVLSGGYFADAGKHGDAFRKAGWFLSGDVGRLDADGFVSITGRIKNMLIRGGEKVYLEDVDRCLETHPTVASACCVRVGARRHEDEAVAFAVGRGATIDKAALGAYVVATLGPFSRLDDIVQVDEIPRTPSGKALRQVLLDRYVDRR